MGGIVNSFILSLLVLQFLTIWEVVSAINVTIYKDSNFTDIHEEYVAIFRCNNLPIDTSPHASASISSDTCFIAYDDYSCKRDNWSKKYFAGKTQLTQDNLRNIKSLQYCTDEEGGTQLNFDIGKAGLYNREKEVLQSYKNVCSCVNFDPKYYSGENVFWYIDNHHNALFAYDEQDCNKSFNYTFIKAEFVDKNNYLRNFYKSYGPDPESPYFKSSCGSEQDVEQVLVTEVNTGTTERVKEVDINERIEMLTNKVMQLGNQVEQLLKRVNIQNGSEVTLKCNFV